MKTIRTTQMVLLVVLVILQALLLLGGDHDPARWSAFLGWTNALILALGVWAKEKQRCPKT